MAEIRAVKVGLFVLDFSFYGKLIDSELTSELTNLAKISNDSEFSWGISCGSGAIFT